MKTLCSTKLKLQFTSVAAFLVSRLHAMHLADLATNSQLIGPANQEGNFWVNIGVATGCTLFAGLMSGLTVGLASIDRLSLEVDAMGSEKVKKLTERIFPVIDQHHWMLVTLLLCNAAAMETLPIFLDRIFKPATAVLISVTLILMFGEIIPQALCTGPKQIIIAYYMCPVVSTLMWITAIISFPIAKFLDYLLGEHKFQRYDNDQLKQLVLLHSVNALKSVEDHIPEGIKGLGDDQARIIQGAISFHDAKCEEVMTEIQKVQFTLQMDTVLTKDLIKKIKRNGFSRVPIIESDNYNRFIGILLVKSCLGVDLEEGKTIKQLYKEREIEIKIPLYTQGDCKLHRLVDTFQKGITHMAVVCNDAKSAQYMRDYADSVHASIKEGKTQIRKWMHFDGENREQLPTIKVLGILTHENLIEKVLGAEISDEKDRDKMKNMRSATYLTHNDMLSQISDQDQQVFKSKFVMRYYNTLYHDIKETLKNPNSIQNIPHFNPQKEQQYKTSSISDEVDLKLEVVDPQKQKRAMTVLQGEEVRRSIHQIRSSINAGGLTIDEIENSSGSSQNK